MENVQSDVDKKYKYWRLRTIYSIYFGYVIYTFTRKSITYLKMPIKADFGFDNADIGILFSVLSIAISVGKLVNGVIADRANPRYFMALGLFLTGISNIFLGFSNSIYTLAIFCFLNGWFQSWGWPACTKQLTHWYTKQERGTWWGIVSTSHNLGNVLIPLLVGVCASLWGWRSGMYISGLIAVVISLLLLERLRGTPQSLGLPTVEEYRGTPEEKLEDKEQQRVGKSIKGTEWQKIKYTLVNYVLKNPKVWMIAITYFFVYIVRTAINDWIDHYFVYVKGYSPLFSASMVSYFEIGGAIGVLAAGIFSDYFFKGNRIPYVVVCVTALFLSLLSLWGLGTTHYSVDIMIMFIIGFFVFGPHMLLGLSAAENVHKSAASTSNGFVGCLGAIGAALAGHPVGYIIDNWGWNGFFTFVTICITLSFFLLVPMIYNSKNVYNVEELEKEDALSSTSS